MVEPENAEALATTLQELFRDPVRRTAMGEFGRRYALQHWDAARILPNFESHLLEASRYVRTNAQRRACCLIELNWFHK